MKIQSPLSNLATVLEKVCRDAVEHAGKFRKNEDATRMTLIDPVLQALGWEIRNPNMVEVEKTVGRARVDYLLSDHQDRRIAAVEAKKLDGNLETEDIHWALARYVRTCRMRDIFLTNGLVWHHYVDFNIDDPRPVRILDFSRDDLVECALYLIEHLDAAKFWIAQEKSAQPQPIPEISASDAREPKTAKRGRPKRREESETDTKPSSGISPSESEAWVDLDAASNLTRTKPSRLRLPDGKVLQVRNWKDVFRESCLFVLDNTPNLPVELPDRSERKVMLISPAKPKKGLSFFEAEYKGRTIYIYANYDADNCVANARYILGKVPESKLKHKAAVVFSAHSSKQDV